MRFRMDWQATKFDWNRARAFLVTAEEGSLSAAARALGMTQPTLGRQVAALEGELGVTLFERTGHGLTLTPAGLELLEHVRPMGEAATRMSLSAHGQSQAISGPVTITASEIVSAFQLPPVIAKIHAAHPGINIEIVATNEVRDLKRREADIAVRNAPPKQPDLIARKLREDTAQLYASPAYLDRIGNPQSVRDLNAARFIGFDHSMVLVSAYNERGMSVTADNFPIATENHLVQWELAKQGHGIGIFPTRIGDPEPGLRRVAEDFASISYPIWLVAHRDLSTNRRIRLVYDTLADLI